MTATNDITGDAIKTRVNEGKKKFDANISLIEPSCFKDCNYLKNTLNKCKVCDWKDKNGS